MSRLIDADDLRELFLETISAIAKRPEMDGNLEYMIRSSAMAIKMIDDQPTVDAVVHGHWEESNPKNSDTCRLIKCSKCGFSYIVGFNVPYEDWIEGRNYCVRCGAKMDESTQSNDSNTLNALGEKVTE